MKKLSATFILLANFFLFACEDPGEEIFEEFNQKSHTVDPNEETSQTGEIDEEHSQTGEIDEEHSQTGEIDEEHSQTGEIDEEHSDLIDPNTEDN